jgi:hypothetical protein
MSEKRTIREEEKKGFSVQELIIIAVLLAAGAVLKLLVGSVINFFGMKPNFIIAAYCLAILLVRPKVYQAAIIGLLAGAICQFLPGTPWLNLISELIGATAMGLLIRVPMKLGKFDANPMISTFISTVLSGGAYTICLFAFVKATAEGLVAYVPIVLCTALINMVLVQLFYIPLQKVLKK